VWASIVLTLVRLSGIPFNLMLPVLLGWVAFQALTLVAGKQLAAWYHQRRTEIATSRST
jgi:hypothetical protein